MADKTAEDVARIIIDKYNKHAYLIANDDDPKHQNWEYDKELAKDIQQYAESQTEGLKAQMKDQSANYRNEVEHLKAENEKLKGKLKIIRESPIGKVLVAGKSGFISTDCSECVWMNSIARQALKEADGE